MVDKVDIISAQQKFALSQIQTPTVSAKAEKPQEDTKRNVDWKTIGAAGTALAALVIGGIYWARSGKSSGAVDKAGQKLGEEVSTAAAKGEETLKKLLPFEFDTDGPILKYIGKGRDIADADKPVNEIVSAYLPDELELNKVMDLPRKGQLFYSEDSKSFRYFDSYVTFFKLESDSPDSSYKKIFECLGFDDRHRLFVYQNDDSTRLMFDGSYDFDIKIDNKTQKVLSAEAGNQKISKENTENILKDFDINKYISDKNYRTSFNAKLSEFASIEEFAAKFKKSVDEIKELAQTPECKEIIKKAQVLRDPDTNISVKCITDNLNNIFGLNVIKSGFGYTSNLSESNIFNFLNRKCILLDAVPNSIVDGVDSTGNVVKYRDGIRIRPKFCKIDITTGKITGVEKSQGELIEASADGRYIRYENVFNDNEMVYINPKEITGEIPRITRNINKNGLFEVKEYSDRNVFKFGNDEKEISIEYIPDTKGIVRAKSFIKDLKTGETQEISAEKETAIKDLINIFDFTGLSAKDYITAIKGLIAEILK